MKLTLPRSHGGTPISLDMTGYLRRLAWDKAVEIDLPRYQEHSGVAIRLLKRLPDRVPASPRTLNKMPARFRRPPPPSPPGLRERWRRQDRREEGARSRRLERARRESDA